MVAVGTQTEDEEELLAPFLAASIPGGCPRWRTLQVRLSAAAAICGEKSCKATAWSSLLGMVKNGGENEER